MTTSDIRSDRIRRQARHKLLSQFAQVGRSAERILDKTELSEGQRAGLVAIVEGANKLRESLDD